MCKKRLDSREVFPLGMEEYIGMYGWHFSKKLCEWAVSKMRRRNRRTGSDEPMKMSTKEEVDALLRRYGIDPSGYTAYDAVYVMHMAKADYYESSIADEQHLALFVRDYLCDPDGYDEVAMTRFYADCIGCGEMPPWEDCL